MEPFPVCLISDPHTPHSSTHVFPFTRWPICLFIKRNVFLYSLLWHWVETGGSEDKEATWVQSLGREDPLEKGMAIHFSILAWRVPWTEEPGELQSIGSQRVRHEWSDLTKQSTLYPKSESLVLQSVGCLYTNEARFIKQVLIHWFVMKMVYLTIKTPKSPTKTSQGS